MKYIPIEHLFLDLITLPRFLAAKICTNSEEHSMYNRFLWFNQGFFGIPWFYSGKTNRCTVNLLFDWFGISCMTTDNFCFYLQNRLIQTSETRGTVTLPPLVIPWFYS
jgi:hypothetical protein